MPLMVALVAAVSTVARHICGSDNPNWRQEDTNAVCAAYSKGKSLHEFCSFDKSVDGITAAVACQQSCCSGKLPTQAPTHSPAFDISFTDVSNVYMQGHSPWLEPSSKSW
jgi:hypothetical protein